MRVIVFGAFDPLHAGHLNLFKQARQAANGADQVKLVVVVARDSSIREVKQREPEWTEEIRLAKVKELDLVDEAILGQEWPTENRYQLLCEMNFDVVALGYDQQPSDEEIRRVLEGCGKQKVPIIRLKPWRPDRYKSSLLRKN